MPDTDTIFSRSVLKRVGTSCGVVGAVSGAGTGTAIGKHDALVELPAEQHAKRLDDHPDVEATVKIERAFLPEGGWIALWLGTAEGSVIGHSMIRLGNGHFRNAPVSVGAPLEGSRTVYATIHRDDGDRQFDPESDDRYQGSDATDSGTVRF